MAVVRLAPVTDEQHPVRITVEQYAALCDVVETAWMHWPVNHDGADFFTSDYAREGANRIMEVLGLEHEDFDVQAHAERIAEYQRSKDMKDSWHSIARIVQPIALGVLAGSSGQDGGGLFRASQAVRPIRHEPP